MSPAQYVALAQLVGSGPLNQTELVGRLSITRATGVRLVDRMERDGWVVRQKDPRDERVKLVVPTQKAARVWEQISYAGRAVVDRAYQGTGTDQIEMVKQILEKVRDNLRL